VSGKHGIDTVKSAEATSDEEQPYAELGLQTDEYARIKELLGRRPTQSELAMYSIMWSEHCSYKSSKVHLRQFGQIPKGDRMLVGMGENAGVVDVGEGLAVTFKVESHNHPSYVEPYQGAATGIGGIVRDILTMGARPVLVMDPLRFGDADHPDTKRVLPGIVAGIGGYGNCLGLPNVGGEVVFDPSYQGNPLVNALCLGVLRHLRGGRTGQPARGAGRGPVHREAAHRGLPRDVRRRPGRRHPGPRWRRPHVCADRDQRGREVGHGRPPRPGAAARGQHGPDGGPRE
jgi:phosphoribosylformylglycinamidine (FGAM) synthase-like enzyme